MNTPHLNPRFLEALKQALDGFPTPFYAYDLTVLEEEAEALRKAFPKARFFFALKANPALLPQIKALGFGAEAVSAGEVERALGVGLSPEEIVWNGPVKTPWALQRFQDRPPVTVLDSEADLLRVSRHLKGAQVLLRVNPDLPVRTHGHLATGRGESQFGVLPQKLPGFLRRAEGLGLLVLGLHLHLGSGLDRAEDFLEGYAVLQRLRTAVGPQRVLNLGGGFGLDLPLGPLGPAMEDLARLYGAKIWLEPGRRLVARSGVLVTRIWGVKRTRKTYLLLDAGMTSFLRPLLYGARHPVLPLYQSEKEAVFDLAGPACEAADVLARGVRLPVPKEGEALVFLLAGAYGASMAMPYLDTPRPLELAWDGSGWRVLDFCY